MELELRQNYIGYWESQSSKVISKEEVSEMIVPDACPDILQILDGDGTLLLQRRDALDGQISYSGYIKVSVLYEPDGEGKLCSMEAILPISATVEMPEIRREANSSVMSLISTPAEDATNLFFGFMFGFLVYGLYSENMLGAFLVGFSQWHRISSNCLF